MNTLTCDGIQLSFGLRKILNSIYMRCETGQVVGLLGRNGSGKSSLMKVITGSLAAESKSVRINDRSFLYTFSKYDLAYLPQHHFIPSFLTIESAFRIYGVRVHLVNKYFPELSAYLRTKPSQLSGGVLKIFEVLLVAALPVKFFLLDEPFSGVMPVYVDRLKIGLNDLKKDKGIVLTDHLYKHVTDLADVLYVLSNGQTYRVTKPEDLVRYGYLPPL